MRPCLGGLSIASFQLRCPPMERTQKIVIEKTLPSARLDAYLRGVFPAVSRGAIQRLIEEGHITVNGRKVKPTQTPRAGDTIEVRWPEARPAEAQPEEIPLEDTAQIRIQPCRRQR